LKKLLRIFTVRNRCLATCTRRWRGIA